MEAKETMERAFATLQYQQVDKDFPFQPPRRHYEGDAGLDLACSEDVDILPGRRAQIRTNIAVALPAGVWAMLVGRSSTFFNLGLIVTQAVIDNGYRGELFASVYNTSPTKHIHVDTGDRLIQLVMFPLVTLEVIEVDGLPTSHRQDKGFGSTGR